MKLLPLLLIPLLALALPAFAQTAPDPQPGDQGSGSSTSDASASAPAQHRTGRDRFLEADTNGDGKLSRTEAQAMPFVAKHFDEIDTNHDGYITREELRAARERMKAARAQRNGGTSDAGNDGSN